MKIYKNYTVDDFVQDEAFRTWVRGGQPALDEFWPKWIADHPGHRSTIEDARGIILAIQPVEDFPLSEKEALSEIFNIMREVELSNHNPSITKRRWLYPLGIAASVTLILAVATWLFFDFTSKSHLKHAANPSIVDPPTPSLMIERVNEGEKSLLINLPDSSSVLLSKNSSIKFPSVFDKENRDVFFSGHAFFEVTKKPKRPFRIFTHNIMAKVLGTSFDVNTLEDPTEVRVTVKSGSVSIYTERDTLAGFDNSPSVILKENEQAVVNVRAKAIQHVRFDSGSKMLEEIPDTYLKARNTPVAEVFAKLERTYGVKIVYKPEQLQGCSLTATFKDEPFPLKMDLICASIGVTYEAVNDTININGIGCNP